MATKIIKTLKGRTLRLTRVDACGAPVTGACSSIVTNGFVQLTVGFEYEDGEDHTQKNAFGELEISEKDAPQVKWSTVALQMARVNPHIYEFIANAALINDGTDDVGYAMNTVPNVAAFGVEVWTKQAGRDCEGGNPAWGYGVAPFCVNGQVGDKTVQNGPITLDYTAEGLKSTADWGVGPYGDNPLLAAAGLPVGVPWAFVRTTVQPPAETNGCAAIS